MDKKTAIIIGAVGLVMAFIIGLLAMFVIFYRVDSNPEEQTSVAVETTQEEDATIAVETTLEEEVVTIAVETTQKETVTVVVEQTQAYSDRTTKAAHEATTAKSYIPENTTKTLANETGAYTVNVPASGTLALRTEPDRGAVAITFIPDGNKLTVTQVVETSSGKWGKTTYSGFSGWVLMVYLERCSVTETTKPFVPETATNAPSFAPGTYKVDTGGIGYLNMRDGHSIDCVSIKQVPDGAEITIVETFDDGDRVWGKTTYGGHTGWIAMQFLVN